MLFRRAMAAAAVVFAGAGAGAGHSQDTTVASVIDFDPVGPGVTENPLVMGTMTIVSTEIEPGLVNTQVSGMVLGLKPFTTYDLRIREGSGNEVVRPDAFTTGFLGFRMVQFTFEGLPFALTDQPIVDLFIDNDGEPENMTESEMRASGDGGGG